MRRAVMFFTFFFAWSGSVLSQTTNWWISYSPPFPIIGWDSLAKRINYPDLCVRAGFEGLYYVSVSIDSTGIITEIDHGDLPNIFHESVTHAIRSTAWQPARHKDIPRPAAVRIPLFFYLYTGNNSKPLVIDSFMPLVERTY